jgi:tRNA nucleotidyltransferase/poly(A) polymerase
MPAPAAALTRVLLDAADARDLRVHLVGGPVRDLLLGRPVRDVDLVVEDAARGVVETLARDAAPESTRVTAHDRFGTVSLDT